MKRWLFSAVVALGCDSSTSTPVNEYADTGVDVEVSVPDSGEPLARMDVSRVFPTDALPGVVFDDCPYASPQAFASSTGVEVLQAVGEWVVALSPQDGSERWRVEVPAPDGEVGVIVGTPAIVGDKMVVAYYTTDRAADGDAQPERLRHRVVMIDLAARRVDSAFPTIELSATFPATGGGALNFLPNNALARAQVVVGRQADDVLGRAYVTYGNVRDIQPWHGFAFEIDLDAWAAGEPAISGRLVTTPESDCGQAGVSGSRDRICGGGLWQPSGPLVVPQGDTYELILAPGNGQLDLARNDFANTLMRVGPGLEFDPGCDAQACADFDPDDPSIACMTSCQNLFIPRRLAADGPMRPESGVCEGLTMFECWQKLDYVGGSTPVALDLPQAGRVLAYPTKDGAVYLVDGQHLGKMHDRAQLVEICGTRDEPCRWDWAGMIVTQPAVSHIHANPVIIVPTFMPDTVHPAGVVGLEVVDGPTASLRVLWQAPNFSTAESVSRFREHPSRPTVASFDGLEVVWVAEAKRGGPGRLVGVRTWDGELLVDVPMAGPGNRFTQPLVVEDTVFVPSCGTDRDSGFVEAYRVNVLK